MSYDMADNGQSLIASFPSVPYIPNAPLVRLHKFDVARNIAIAPNEKRYVVASYADTILLEGFVTAVYPQQNNYLTLVRLTLCEYRSHTAEEAVQQHITLIQAIQQGKLSQYVQMHETVITAV